MDDDLDELLGDLDILGQVQEDDHHMERFRNEDDIETFGEMLGCQNNLADSAQTAQMIPLENIMEVEDRQQDLFWGVPRSKARIYRPPERGSDPKKRQKGFLNLSTLDQNAANLNGKAMASRHGPGPKFKPSHAVQEVRSKRKIAPFSENIPTNQAVDQNGRRGCQGFADGETKDFRTFDRREEIDGECVTVVSSTGRIVYVPCEPVKAPPNSDANLSQNGLLSIPIRQLIEECTKDTQEASRRKPNLMDSRLMPDSRSDSRLPWVQEYAPQNFRNLLSDDRLNRDILKWLKSWDSMVFGENNQKAAKNGSTATKMLPDKKVALLSGPPGTGKTSLSRVVAEHCGYQPLFINASDDRTKQVLQEKIGNAVSMKGMFGSKKPNCLILDEIDGMLASESQGAIEALLEILEPDRYAPKNRNNKKNHKSKELCRPIICICNDLYAPSLRPLRELAKIFSFKCTKSERLVARLEAVCAKEQVTVNKLGLQTLASKTEGDIRACLNTLQFLSSKSKHVSSDSIEQSSFGNKDFKQSVFNIWDDLLFTQSVHRQSKRRDFHKSTNFYNLYTKLEEFGEFELVSRGIFENVGKLRFFDPTLEKCSSVADSLSNCGRLQWSLPQYMPSCIIAAARQIGSIQKVLLQWPNQEMSANRKRQYHITLLERWMSKFSPKTLGTSQGVLSALYLIPALKKILVPRISPHQGKDLSEQDSFHVARLAKIMQLHGLKFDLQPKLLDGAQSPAPVSSILPLYPGVHVIHEYNLRGSVYVPEEARYCVNLRIEWLCRCPSNALSQTGCSRASKKQKANKRHDTKQVDADPAMSDGGSNDANYMRTNRSMQNKDIIKKRPSTWLDVHRKEKRRRFRMQAQSTHRPPLTFYFDEGKTDAVRRPASFQDFI